MREVKILQVNLSYLMKDGEFYTSPLPFDNINEYSRIDYFFINYSNDNRGAKRIKPTNFLLGHIHKVGRIIRRYLSSRVVNLSKSTTFLITSYIINFDKPKIE